MEGRTASALVRRAPWLWGRKKRLATAANCLERNGWAIAHVSTKELVAGRLEGATSYTVTFRPPEKAVIGWAGNPEPDDDQQPPLPECFYEFMR